MTEPTAIQALASDATKVLFFTGKGGVGKTSAACAVAVALADDGNRVLLVSTDPASNLDEVLAMKLSDKPTAIPGAAALDAMNIDPEQAAASYRESMVGPYRGVLPDAAVASMEEQLSGACTVEIAAFNEFARLVGDPASTAEYDNVIFDTAPTGHTLRLLTLPTAWSEFIETNTTGESCLGPLAGLSAYRDLYSRTMEALSNPQMTTLVLVSRPEVSALKEAARSSDELRDLGVTNQRLVLNGLFVAHHANDPIAAALQARGSDAVNGMPESLSRLSRVEVPLLVAAPVGLDGLRALIRAVPGPQQADGVTPEIDVMSMKGLSGLVGEIASRGSGVVMTMGKGGVGKTTVAAAIAVRLAEQGHRVHLSTTDPAAHVAEALAGSSSSRLEMSKIDPAVEVSKYREHVLSTSGRGLEPAELAMLEEDLRSPCTEEIAVFRAFARVVADANDRFVILDTAPTGHTLLLLDASEAYHREVTRNATDTPPEVLELLPRLRDPDFCKVVIVTLPEATPVSEAERLQRDLQRAGINPHAWVINQSFALVQTADPVLRQRGANEVQHIQRVIDAQSTPVFAVPWVAQPPVGDGLGALTSDATGRHTPRQDDLAESPQREQRYTYFCKWCGWSFDHFVRRGLAAPPMTKCPTCEIQGALLMGPADDSTPLGGCCPPGSGCCGTPGSA